MRFPRGIAYKLAIVFLLLGLLPMISVGVIAYFVAKKTLAEDQVESFVERVARDTSINLDTSLKSMREGTRLLAKSTNLRGYVYDISVLQSDSPEYRETSRQLLSDLNSSIDIFGYADLLAIVDLEGRILVTSNRSRRRVSSGRLKGNPGNLSTLLWSDIDSNPLIGRSFADRSWWPAAKTGQATLVSWGIDRLIQEIYEYPKFSDDDVQTADSNRDKNAEAFCFGFSEGIPLENGDRGQPGQNKPQAILLAFFNWTAVQGLLDRVNKEFLEEHEQYKSGYTFLFGGDLNTVIAHRYRALYSTRLLEDHQLPELREAMQESPGRIGHKHYVYLKEKVAGFSPVNSTGWQLGFGIDRADYLEAIGQMRNLMLVAGLFIAGIIIVLIAIASRRITRPITRLIKQTNEISRGNLDARVDLKTHDEIGLLGDSFNKMAEDLKISNKKLIQAEKTAAWQEMARQVAHEIKNPLTPIKLSAQLVQRAFTDKHPDFQKILEESVASIVKEADSLKKIAANFSNYASFPKTERKNTAILKLLEECVKLYQNAESSGVEVRLESFLDEDLSVSADRDELRRVFLNIFNNALEAMQDGGRLNLSVFVFDQEDGSRLLEVRFKDTGPGISPEIAARLFEPYFTTRTSGTGLGLAICKKTIEGYGGDLSVISETNIGTTVAVKLPVAAD